MISLLNYRAVHSFGQVKVGGQDGRGGGGGGGGGSTVLVPDLFSSSSSLVLDRCERSKFDVRERFPPPPRPSVYGPELCVFAKDFGSYEL